MPRILAADIGGTHSRFALFLTPDASGAGPGDGPPLILAQECWLAGSAYAAFPEALHALLLRGKNGAPPLLDRDAPPDIAVIAPAGPVQEDICRMPNLPWIVRGQDVREILGIACVHLINDFVAQAHACLLPETVEATRVLEGTPRQGAPVAVMGAGTGFGQALLLNAPVCGKETGSGAPCAGNAGEPPDARLGRLRCVRVLPSEGGHTEVPFVGAEEFAFAEFVAKRVGTPRLIADAIVSGSGLAHLLAFHTGLDSSPREAAAQAPEHPEVMAWYARLYARLCRNYVLHTLALGGLYITAGMAMRVPVTTHPVFVEEFHNHTTQRSLLGNVPVWHVRSPRAGLWGAALYGLLRHPPAQAASGNLKRTLL